MKLLLIMMVVALALTGFYACKDAKVNNKEEQIQMKKELTAKDILGNPQYLAISYGGYREISRDIRKQPTLSEIKDDLKILYAMGIRVLRTYNVHYPHAFNILVSIRQLKEEDPDFEMYVMLGAWIDCKNAWTDLEPDHNAESEQNASEMARAIALASQFSDIVKILAVGNEAMIRWAESYYVQPAVILKWVNHLQSLKKEGKLPADLWITSSDDFASWGGGDTSYHTETLAQLVAAVDYISMHTYPYHNSHYNPEFWLVPEEEEGLSDIKTIEAAVLRAKQFAMFQYDSVVNYVKSLGLEKPVHIGETGWATVSTELYGSEGSRASDEFKQGLYYKYMRDWTNSAGISCFYFEAFNEKWKDAHNQRGSENHFGLFTIAGQAKYPMWELVDKDIFNGLTRNGNPITKTYGGDQKALMKEALVPPSKKGHMSIH
ncbi:MAG: glycosyl hydrolase family 17 [Flavobacteriaceae bacterium]